MSDPSWRSTPYGGLEAGHEKGPRGRDQQLQGEGGDYSKEQWQNIKLVMEMMSCTEIIASRALTMASWDVNGAVEKILSREAFKRNYEEEDGASARKRCTGERYSPSVTLPYGQSPGSASQSSTAATPHSGGIAQPAETSGFYGTGRRGSFNNQEDEDEIQLQKVLQQSLQEHNDQERRRSGSVQGVDNTNGGKGIAARHNSPQPFSPHPRSVPRKAFPSPAAGRADNDLMIIDDKENALPTRQAAVGPQNFDSGSGGDSGIMSGLEKAAIGSNQDEDANLSRAIYESLQVNRVNSGDSGTAGKSTTGNADVVDLLIEDSSTNPNERLRSDNMPAGLMNIGNTCYFNSLIQTYFMIPAFRQCLFNFSVPLEMPGSAAPEGSSGVEKMVLDESSGSKKMGNVSTVDPTPSESAEASSSSNDVKVKRKQSAMCCLRELQQLFAFLMLTKRKYIDPSKLVRTLMSDKNSCSSPSSSGTQLITVGNQQDVGEFNSFFLEHLEEGMKASKGISSPEWVVVKKPAMSTATPPQQVVDYASSNPIQDFFYGTMLVRTMAKEEDGSCVLNTVEEQFTSVILDVNRFQGLYESLDSYTETSEIENFETPKKFKTKASKDVWFKSFPPVMTFQLQRVYFDKSTLTAEKIHTSFDFKKKIFVDRYMEQNMEETLRIRKQLREINEKINKLEKDINLFDNFQESKVSVEQSLLNSMGYVANGMSGEPTEPYPRIASQNEAETALRVLQRCLDQACDDRENLVKQREILIQEREVCNFHTPALMQMPYCLHAVLVHEGQTTGGHYWAFIFDHVRDCWKKFNDKIVSDVSEETVWKESVGGCGYKSAYCLIYVEERYLKEGQSISNSLSGTSIKSGNDIPEWLEQIIKADNAELMAEVDSWNDLQGKDKSGESRDNAINIDEGPSSVSSEYQGEILFHGDPRLNKCLKSSKLSKRSKSPEKASEASIGDNSAAEMPLSSNENCAPLKPTEKLRIKGGELQLQDFSRYVNSSINNWRYSSPKVTRRVDNRLEGILPFFLYASANGQYEALREMKVLHTSDTRQMGKVIAIENALNDFFCKSTTALTELEVGQYNEACGRDLINLPFEEMLARDLEYWKTLFASYKQVMCHFIDALEAIADGHVDEAFANLCLAILTNLRLSYPRRQLLGYPTSELLSFLNWTMTQILYTQDKRLLDIAHMFIYVYSEVCSKEKENRELHLKTKIAGFAESSYESHTAPWEKVSGLWSSVKVSLEKGDFSNSCMYEYLQGPIGIVEDEIPIPEELKKEFGDGTRDQIKTQKNKYETGAQMEKALSNLLERCAGLV
eukprot:Nk52_evm31s152 gene=Nk52_evmTU31s152